MKSLPESIRTEVTKGNQFSILHGWHVETETGVKIRPATKEEIEFIENNIEQEFLLDGSYLGARFTALELAEEENEKGLKEGGYYISIAKKLIHKARI